MGWPYCAVLVMTCWVIVDMVMADMVITAEVNHRDNERTSANCCRLRVSLPVC